MISNGKHHISWLLCVSLADYQTFMVRKCFACNVEGEAVESVPRCDYESIFLATVMHSGPRIIRIISMISCVPRPSTTSSFI